MINRITLWMIWIDLNHIWVDNALTFHSYAMHLHWLIYDYDCCCQFWTCNCNLAIFCHEFSEYKNDIQWWLSNVYLLYLKNIEKEEKIGRKFWQAWIWADQSCQRFRVYSVGYSKDAQLWFDQTNLLKLNTNLCLIRDMLQPNLAPISCHKQFFSIQYI